MKFLCLLFLVLPTTATKCGKWYSSDCLGETDKRYDPGYTNNLKDQDPLWSRLEGYWINEFVEARDPSTGIDEKVANFGFPGSTRPYMLSKAFYNNTFDGSRYMSNRYYIYLPADEDFCNQAVPVGMVNVVGNGECGINGLARSAGLYGTSSYEKNGDITILSSTGVYSDRGNAVNSNMTTITDDTFYFVSVIEGVIYNGANLVFLNNFTEISGTQTSYGLVIPGIPIIQSLIFRMTRVSRDDWVAAIEQEYELANILPEDRVEGGVLPTLNNCIAGDECPTEEEWCTIDPNCSISPFQEPDAIVKAGPIVGFVLLGCTIIVGIIVAYFMHKIRKIRAKAKHEFARRVAESIKLTPGDRQLTPEALAAEFQKIDKDNDGTVSKDELWQFVSSGKVSVMTQSEFDALFAVMDANGSGTIDCLEFFAYMCECQSDFEEAKNRASIRQVRPSFAVGSNRVQFATETARRMSSRMGPMPSISEPADDDEDVEAKLKETA